MHIAYPESWAGQIDRLMGAITLEVAGFEVAVRITHTELTNLYFPLLALLKETADAQSHRTLAALAGIPACGKTTLAATLQYLARALMPPDELLIVGMDGWHYPNSILDAR